MTDLTGKTALVTGAARGIGRAIALRYAALGANVVVNYAGSEEAATVTTAEARGLGAEAIAVKADVSRPAEVERLFAEAIQRFGTIDIVVANAGIEIIERPVLETTEEEFDRLFAVNAKGAFFTLQSAARHIADGGRIINIGSSTGQQPAPGIGLYGASKTASRYLVGVLALEIGHSGVTLNNILPTSIEGSGVYTDIAEDDPFRLMMSSFRPIGGRLGLPGDVADAAEYFAGDLAAWVSGQALLISGGAQQ